MTAHLIWSFGIVSETAYQITGAAEDWKPRTGFGTGVGPFKLTQGQPLPFAGLSFFDFLSDNTYVRQINPTYCNPATTLHCTAYVFIGDSSLIVADPDRTDPNQPSAVILRDVPVYVLEFKGNLPRKIDNDSEEWQYCRSHTSEVGSYLELCMMGSQPSVEIDWNITTAMHFCLSEGNCPDVVNVVDGDDAYNNTAYEINVLLQMANTTVIIDLINGSIVDVSTNFETRIYPVNISELFLAFSSPLTYSPVNVTALLEIDYFNSSNLVDSFTPIFLPVSNPVASKAVVDQFVDFLVYSFTTPLPDEAPIVHLRGLLSYALVTNSGLYYGIVSGTQAEFTYTLRVNPCSLWSYFALNSFVVGISLMLLLLCRPEVDQYQILYPELSIPEHLKDDVVDLLIGDGDITTTVHHLANVKIKLNGNRLCIYKQ